MSTPDRSFTSIGSLAEMLARAYELISELPGDEAKSWSAACRNLSESLTGNRKALYARVREALGAASVCWDPRPEGEFQSEEADVIADRLMHYFDAYADSLPLVRHVSLLELDVSSPEERLAAAIFELSANYVHSQKWDDASDFVKRALRDTASQLLHAGMVATDAIPDELTPSDMTPEEKERLKAEMSRTRNYADDYELLNSLRMSNPNLHLPPRVNCLPGCNRLDGHDGRDPGACMRNGTVISTGLPPNIGMPAGFNPDELKRRELQLLEDQEQNDTIGEIGRLRLAELRTELSDG